MKILAEEIVRKNVMASDAPDGPDKGPGNRYRRSQIGLLDCPVEMLAVIQDGHALIIDEGDGTNRRKLMIANVRMAVLRDVDHVGLIVDLINPELYKALEEDQDAPADYAAFCELEKIEP